MITYTYTARSLDGNEVIKAEVQAESEQAAAKVLIEQKLFPINIVPKGQGSLKAHLPFLNNVRSKDRVIFTRQLSTLINAGLPLVQSLHTVRTQLSSKPLQAVADQVIAAVEGGLSLSAAFAKHPKVFNGVYVSLVAAGESSGTLDEALERLASQQEKDAAIIKKIRGAMLYPLIVVGVMVAVLIFMLTTVLPQIAQLYRDLRRPLPPVTKFLIATSNFVIQYWWLVIILLGLAIFAFISYLQTESGRRVGDTIKLKVPIIGKLFQKVYMARYSRTLGTLLSSGLPMLEALGVVKSAVNNVLLADSITQSMGKVKGGKALSETIEGDPYFLPLVPQMIAIGEQSGGIDDMLTKLAFFYENEVDEEIKNLSTILEPALMVILGLMVAFIIAAILLPIYSLIGSGGLSGLK